MKLLLTALTGLLLSGTMCFAQIITIGPAKGMRRYPPKITIHSHPAEPAVSLDQLVRMSQLIVDATVLSNFPAINTHPDPDIPSAETHSLVSVTEVLAGALPGGTLTILLAQEGGKAGRWELVSTDDPLVKPGEHYILFLAPDDRKHPPNTSAYPRYWTIGINAGKAKIENQKVQFLPSTLPRLREHNDTDANAFIATVKAKVSRHVPELKPRP